MAVALAAFSASAAGSSKHLSAYHVFGDLDAGHAYAAAGCLHQHRFARFEVRSIDEGNPGGEVSGRHGGGFVIADVVWGGHYVRTRRDDPLGVAARREPADDALADSQVAHAAAQAGDRARGIPAWLDGEGGFYGAGALAAGDFTAINRGGGDVNEDFAWPWLRVRHVFVF